MFKQGTSVVKQVLRSGVYQISDSGSVEGISLNSFISSVDYLGPVKKKVYSFGISFNDVKNDK